MAAVTNAAPAFDLTSFDEADPQAFYLWERREEMEAMADACLIVEGTRLPVPTQVLSLASGVLCCMFADLQSAEEAGSAAKRKRGRKRKADDSEQELTIEAPFVGFSVQDVALFLRLVYDQRWRGSAAVTFAALHDSLTALLRLAHQLEAPQLLSAVHGYMADCSTAGPSLLMDWLEAAEACQMDSLRATCLVSLARNMAGWGDDLASAMGHASLVERCDKRTLTQLLGLMTATGKRRTGSQRLATAVPRAAEVQAATVVAANPGVFSWIVAQFSEQPSGVGECVRSPEFKAAGHSWQLRICPGGSATECAGFISAHLEYKGQVQDVSASCILEALDANGVAQPTRTAPSHVFRPGHIWGWGKFASRDSLAEEGLLEGDSLRLRITVQLRG